MLGPSHGTDDHEDGEEDIEALFKNAQREERQHFLDKSRQGPIRSSGKTVSKVEEIPLEEIQQKAARRASCVGYTWPGLNADGAKNKPGGKDSSLDELFAIDSKGGGKGMSGAASVHGGGDGYNPASLDNRFSSGASCAGDFASSSRKKTDRPSIRHHSHSEKKHPGSSELSSTIDGIISGARKYRMDLKKSADSPRSHRAQLNSTTKSLPKKVVTDTGGIVMPIAEEKKKSSSLISRLSRRSSVQI